MPRVLIEHHDLDDIDFDILSRVSVGVMPLVLFEHRRYIGLDTFESSIAVDATRTVSRYVRQWPQDQHVITRQPTVDKQYGSLFDESRKLNKYGPNSSRSDVLIVVSSHIFLMMQTQIGTYYLLL